MVGGILVAVVVLVVPQFLLLQARACLVQLAILHLVLVDEAHS
jgi:hypothetical protein